MLKSNKTTATIKVLDKFGAWEQMYMRKPHIRAILAWASPAFVDYMTWEGHDKNFYQYMWTVPLVYSH